MFRGVRVLKEVSLIQSLWAVSIETKAFSERPMHLDRYKGDNRCNFPLANQLSETLKFQNIVWIEMVL
jgi:hypothetical protein